MTFVRRVGPEAAQAVHAVVAEAFGSRPPLDPPAAALHETVESIGKALAAQGGLVAELDGAVVGSMVMDLVDDVLFLRRLGVLPSAQHHGVAHGLVAAAVGEAGVLGARGVAVLAREELPATIGFWQDNGFVATGRVPPYVELVRWLPASYDVPDAEAMKELARHLAGRLRAGDLVVLSGELGAGKTTFTQGLGEGLRVRGGITSPTFVIARVHPSLGDGPALVHVDAYRLGGVEELDDLDLDTSLEEAVTVVEWGEGMAEVLADSRLEVTIVRAVGAQQGSAEELDPRRVVVLPVGPRWR